VGADGYGHINEDLIFIERGDHSPHRQEPPAGYEYKGKIEVQGINREVHSASRGAGSVPPPVPISQPVTRPTSVGPCPPGWQQMILGAPGGPCPSGGISYTGQLIGAAGMGQTGPVGYPGGQYFLVSFNPISSYLFISWTNGSSWWISQFRSRYALCITMSNGCRLYLWNKYWWYCKWISTSYWYWLCRTIVSYHRVKLNTDLSFTLFFSLSSQTQQATENVTVRPTIIEVWQKRSKVIYINHLKINS